MDFISLLISFGSRLEVFAGRPLFKDQKAHMRHNWTWFKTFYSQNFIYHCFCFQTLISIKGRQMRKTNLQRLSASKSIQPYTCRLPTTTTVDLPTPTDYPHSPVITQRSGVPRLCPSPVLPPLNLAGSRSTT